MNGKIEYGDYQTPLDFALKFCRFLKKELKINPSAVLEPTCGIGNFIQSSLIFSANEYYGIEINSEYCELCKSKISDDRVKIINSDFFSFSSKSLIKDKSSILIIGNPPWVTSSKLSVLGSDNLPIKTNFKGVKGIDAITGASNFDICEYIILKLIQEYNNLNTTIAMLCKTSVARNIFKELKRNSINFELCDIYEFDSYKVFGINVSACILLIKLSDKITSSDVCNIYDFENYSQIKFKIGFSNGQLYSNLDLSEEDFDGKCCFEWRQGVKHDCSKVMELTLNNDKLQNGKNEVINIESDIVFPLIKSSMFKTPIIHSFTKFVIVTQRKLKEETDYIKYKLPKTWQYLNDNIDLFKNRKSSIYKGTPLFSMFGIGDYSYSSYKVGVSGFYKIPLFSLLYSEDNKPVMTDDTTYFICFDDYNMAYIAMLLLNSEKVQKFLKNIAFLDSKRPYTKKVLERIDFNKIVNSLSFQELIDTENKLNLNSFVKINMYEDFKSLVKINQSTFW